MGYPGMSAEVFQNSNIAILACQLLVMITSLTITLLLRPRVAVDSKAVPH